MRPGRRRLFLAGAALVLAAGPLRAQTVAGWRSFESAAGRFEVAFPGNPVTRRGKLRTDAGEVPSTAHSAGDEAGATYDVRYSDYPKAIMARLTPAKLLDAASDGLVAQSKGRLASEKPFAMASFAGRDQEIVGEDGTRYRVRLLLVENRLYQLTAMARPPARADEDRFFGSFQLMGFSKP